MIPTQALTQELKLVKEAKMFDILDGMLDRRLEASGVIARGELFYVIFDNLPHIARISAELSPAAAANDVIRQDRGHRRDFEDIAHDSRSGRFYVLIESLTRGDGTFMAAVQEYSPSFRYLGRSWLDFRIKRPNKGLEGLACVHRQDQTFLLGLSEGNRCEGGAKGRVPGGGRVHVFQRGSHHWDCVGELRLPKTVLFEDYSGIAVAGDRIAVVSQASSALWVGSLAASSWEITGSGRTYELPRNADGEVIYCTAEGVSWIAEDQVVMVSDKAKPGQPRRCRAKDQSIHIFRIPGRGQETRNGQAAAGKAALGQN